MGSDHLFPPFGRGLRPMSLSPESRERLQQHSEEMLGVLREVRKICLAWQYDPDHIDHGLPAGERDRIYSMVDEIMDKALAVGKYNPARADPNRRCYCPVCGTRTEFTPGPSRMDCTVCGNFLTMKQFEDLSF